MKEVKVNIKLNAYTRKIEALGYQIKVSKPDAKGKVEVYFGTYLNSFIKSMRISLEEINNKNQEEFIEDCRNMYTRLKADEKHYPQKINRF